MQFKNRLVVYLLLCAFLFGCSSTSSGSELTKDSNVVSLSDYGKTFYDNKSSSTFFEFYLLPDYDYAIDFFKTDQRFAPSDKFDSLFETFSSVLLTIFVGSSDSSLKVELIKNEGSDAFSFVFDNGVLEDLHYHIDCFLINEEA